MRKQVMYVCYYTKELEYTGNEVEVFVTANEDKAKEWAAKFNHKLEYWRDKCTKYDDNWNVIWSSAQSFHINTIEYASYYQIELR